MNSNQPPILLTGHSGAEVTLIGSGPSAFVRKRAADIARNDRLRAQAAKLRWAQSAGLPVPTVFGEGEQDGLYYFDMEYILADGAAHRLTTGSRVDWNNVSEQVLSFINILRKTATGSEIPPDHFRKKLVTISTQCASLSPCAPKMKEVSSVIVKLLDVDWSGIPFSECHGDLTLENILVRQDGSVVFIDFDVPEHSSWCLDVAKLFQDLEGMWCIRYLLTSEPNETRAVNAKLALARQARAIGSLVEALLPFERPKLLHLVCFHLLRTLPYARDPILVEFVLERIELLSRQSS